MFADRPRLPCTRRLKLKRHVMARLREMKAEQELMLEPYRTKLYHRQGEWPGSQAETCRLPPSDEEAGSPLCPSPWRPLLNPLLP